MSFAPQLRTMAKRTRSSWTSTASRVRFVVFRGSTSRAALLPPPPEGLTYCLVFHQLYQVQFRSRGSHELSQRVLELFLAAGMPARKTPVFESRGEDGRGFQGPGLDHGVFVPLLRMFGPEMPDSVPVVEVSLDESLDSEKNWAIGKAVSALRLVEFLWRD